MFGVSEGLSTKTNKQKNKKQLPAIICDEQILEFPYLDCC